MSALSSRMSEGTDGLVPSSLRHITQTPGGRYANEAIGKAKQGIGNVIEDLKGDAQKARGDVKNAVAANKTADALKRPL